MDEAPDGKLTRDEILVLAAVLRELVAADGVLSEEELEALALVPRRLAITDADWDGMWDEAIRTLPNYEAAQEAAAGLSRVGARELVYELLYIVAAEDCIVDDEWDLLEWLDEEWQRRYT